MRITKKVFTDLAIWMIGLGILMGLIFPFFSLIFGVEKSIAFSWGFILSCIMAGATVGGLNILISKMVVANRLKFLTNKMMTVENNLMKVAQGENFDKCDLNKCRVDFESEDEIGENIKAYNKLVDTLSITIKSELLTSELEIDGLVEHGLTMLLNVTNSIAGALLIEKEGELVIAKSHSIKNPSSLLTNDIINESSRSLEKVHIKIPTGIKIDGLLTEFKPNEILVIPLLYKSISLGLILLATAESYTDQILINTNIVKRSLSLALHNATVHDQTQKLAALDSLTGIYNRRFGLLRLSEEYSRAVRTNTSLGLIILDIDHFKMVNDTYGHLAGDKVLINITKIISDILRKGDIFLRYGGEEFFVVLPGASSKDSYKIAEKIRHIVKESSLVYSGVEIRVTISLGISSYPDNEVSNDKDLILLADKALYISKDNGRNRTTISRIK